MTATQSLKEELGYDELEDGSVDDLIAYKDALEDALDAAEHKLRNLANAAGAAKDIDETLWELRASGQESDEIEHSGFLLGQSCALAAAVRVLAGDPEAGERLLDLVVPRDVLDEIAAQREHLRNLQWPPDEMEQR